MDQGVNGQRRVALVTGGGRGIGRGIVVELARVGFDVAVNYRSDERAAARTCELAQTAGAGRAVMLRADVGDIGEARALVESALSQMERVDLLVNNAGVAPEVRQDILNTTIASWDRVINTNLRGPYFLTQAVAHAMIAQRADHADREFQIQFISSVSSVFASVNRGEYCVSKAGLSMVAQLFAVRLAEYGIRVFEVRPGIIATDMTAGVKASYDERFASGLAPINRWGTPEEVGRAVASLASGAIPYATGNVVYVDGGLNLRRL